MLPHEWVLKNKIGLMLELKIQRGHVWLFTRRNVNWSWFWSNCILPKNVGQQQIIKHVTIFLKSIFFSTAQTCPDLQEVLVVSTFGTACYTERQTKGKLERERFRLPPYPSLQSFSSTLGHHTLLMPHTLSEWGTFSTRIFPPGNEVCCYANAGGPSSGDPDFLLTKADLSGRHQDNICNVW